MLQRKRTPAMVAAVRPVRNTGIPRLRCAPLGMTLPFGCDSEKRFELSTPTSKLVGGPGLRSNAHLSRYAAKVGHPFVADLEAWGGGADLSAPRCSSSSSSEQFAERPGAAAVRCARFCAGFQDAGSGERLALQELQIGRGWLVGKVLPMGEGNILEL